jgi:uncharacterized protein (DUF2252 family)
MNIHDATRSYEQWMGQHLAVVRRDLVRKHERMAESPFVFLCGSYTHDLVRLATSALLATRQGRAAIMGITDVDPFIMGMTQAAGGGTPVASAATATLVAASSNNVVQGDLGRCRRVARDAPTFAFRTNRYYDPS